MKFISFCSLLFFHVYPLLETILFQILSNTKHDFLFLSTKKAASSFFRLFLLTKTLLCRINENDLFKHDWRSRSRVQVLQYIFLKWLLAFLVGLLTGIIATLINLAVENIAGYKLLAVLKYIHKERLEQRKFLTIKFFVLSIFLLNN